MSRESVAFGGNFHHRQRRSAGNFVGKDEDDDLSDTLEAYEVANFSINAFGEQIHLHLTPYSNFIAPTFTLHYTGNVTDDVDAKVEDVPRHCFYSGRVGSRPDHTAVISICGGLFGAFRTDDTDYLIQPHDLSTFSHPSASGDDDDEMGTKPHRIYRRSTLKAAEQSRELCAFQENTQNNKKSKSESSGHDFSSTLSLSPEETDFVKLLDSIITQHLNRTRIGKRKRMHTRLSGNNNQTFKLLKKETASLKSPSMENSLATLKKLSLKSNNAITTSKLRHEYRKLRKTYQKFHQKRITKPSENLSSATVDKENEPKSRKKRYLSYPRNVEVMVTADNGMVKTHGANLQHYVLTLMAIVHSVYRDASIGNFINIVLVKLVIIGDEDVRHGPRITKNAHDCLRNFCRWQADENDPDDSHPNHHDTAVLITRQDICRSESACDTLGLAELGTMCDPQRSCSINEDNGLSTAFTIAHEIGHEFNAPHDNNDKCKSPTGKPESMHVMSPTLDHKSKPWSWSECSARYITSFLDYGNGQCLLDEPPQRVLPLPPEEPGQIYDVNQQCSFVYGKGVTHCGFMSTCARLWCVSADRRHGCRTPHMPWADGTKCAPGKWCQRGHCVPEKRYKRPVHGVWGEWSKFGDCSRTCGGGVKIAQRECNNPPPRDGGRYCIGKRKRFRSCNWQECKVAKDFRAEQCESYSWSKHNRHQIRGVPNNAVWIPKYDGILLQDRCKLICQVKRDDQYGAPWYVLKPKLINGTPCGPDTHDICVEGICKRAGCDHVLNSNTKEDKCGVCGGDNSGCRTVENVYNYGRREGYNVVTVIPIGATNIIIEQRSYGLVTEDHNYLALKDQSGRFILNGNRNVVQFKHNIKKRSHTGNGYTYQFDYTGTDTLIERINSSRPLMENITVLVLSAGSLLPPNIKYKYNIPLPDQITYSWDPYGPWSACSNACQGRMKKKVLCTRSGDGQVVADNKCHTTIKPPSIQSSCNTHCEIKWQIKSSECSARCGKGVATVKYECVKITTLSTISRDTKTEILPDRECNGPKPSERSVCQGECLPTAWKYGNWTECSRECGGGTQTRPAECKDTNDVLLESTECDTRTRHTSRICNHFSCPQWVTSDYSPCLATCGSGVRHRRVWCRGTNGQKQPDSTCDSTSKPFGTVKCSMKPCPTWKYEEWGKCSVTCGIGTTKRIMRCTDYLGRHVDDEQCNDGLQERDTKPCHESECPMPSYFPSNSKSGRPILINRAMVLPDSILKMAEDENDKKEDTDIFLDVIDAPTVRVPRIQGRSFSRHLPQRVDILPELESSEITEITRLSSNDVQWRTGHWTDCSVTCGIGRRERYVSCRHNNGHEVSDAQCDVTVRPSNKEECNPGQCYGAWRSGAWSECSASCGEGTKTRYVRCMYEMRYDTEERCNPDEKPEITTPCETTVPCPTPSTTTAITTTTSRPTTTTADSNAVVPKLFHPSSKHDRSDVSNLVTSRTGIWRTGPWSECSSSCGSGNQKRAVVCHGNCDLMPMPSVIRLCNAGTCPTWQTGEWSECSVTCGRGISTRTVQCQMADGSTTDDSRCVVMKRPSDKTPCGGEIRRCPGRPYRWRATHWSGCSVTCGRGLKKRDVICVDAEKNRVSDELCQNLRSKKPNPVRKCRTRRRCPRWHTGNWNKCSASCGTGVRVRGVHCRYKRKTMADDYCDSGSKPEDVETCNGTECERYSWKTSSWSSCSTSCGSGVHTRTVTCTDNRGYEVSSIYCTTEDKPQTSGKCDNGPCTAFWHVKPWSECSATCGDGIEHRSVRCVYVDMKTQQFLPASNCPLKNKPDALRRCEVNKCDVDVRWRVGPWSECSAACGEGISERQVVCFSRITDQMVSESVCQSASSKAPDRTSKCTMAPCLPTSCRHAQVQHGAEADGEYYLQIRGKPLKVYCKGMDTRHPSEFITLAAGNDENFSEIYSFSLNNSESCPHNGSRNDHCACTRNPQSGKTTFQKIRFDIRSMKVTVNDFSFATFEYGRPVGFGVAGDCYSRASCPQGEFKINLTGTGLSVNPNTRWSSYGRSAVQRISPSQDGLSVAGKCGGYCGQCRPDPITGLILSYVTER